MKYSLVCECGYQTALTEDEDELLFDLKQDLLNHQEWCEIAIKNGGKHIFTHFIRRKNDDAI